MTGEANVDPNHNIENVLKSVDGIDQNIEKVCFDNLLSTNFLPPMLLGFGHLAI